MVAIVSTNRPLWFDFAHHVGLFLTSHQTDMVSEVEPFGRWHNTFPLPSKGTVGVGRSAVS
ncbi:hypothetical protein [Henriciella pelagia]|jgi:hypothetical protein|uniref:Uncharacterized protein n=1 Tax=Henriciella pelagia TaxID=1977912 RepID=A0ABQ1J2W3_9PROT|nr:hypothetical protein [Henriciella pelagia]GGB56506.1 hypothetical protein GCM10011503_01040 [Henriciella pelagia]